MSEQPGRPAGTGKPNHTPANLHKPWSVSDRDPRIILNALGHTVAYVMPENWADPLAIVESDCAAAAHIVAAVNVAGGLLTEELLVFAEDRHQPRTNLYAADFFVDGSHWSVSPHADAILAEIADSRAEYVADVLSGRATCDGILAGGAL